MPPVLPILKDPGLIPPTVAGPIIVIPFFSALCRISRARYKYVKDILNDVNFKLKGRLTLSGTPSAMMAIDFI